MWKAAGGHSLRGRRKSRMATTRLVEGKPYTFEPAGAGTDVYRGEGVGRTLVGHARREDVALRIATDDATGASAERAKRFFAYLDGRFDAVRTEVKALVYSAGFEPRHTGGGCVAWGKEIDDGSYLLLTADDDGIDADPSSEVWSVGRYADEGFVSLEDPMTLRDCLLASELIPAPVGEEENYPDVEAAVASRAAPAP